jgi:hypothetical protein
LKIQLNNAIFPPAFIFASAFPADAVKQANDVVAMKNRGEQDPHKDPDDPETPRTGADKGAGSDELVANQGKLLVVATCTSGDITCPADLGFFLFSESESPYFAKRRIRIFKGVYTLWAGLAVACFTLFSNPYVSRYAL